MARSSSRRRILDATLAVAAGSGMRAVTFEAVSAEAGLTKAGVLYHFPSRDELLRAVAHHVIDQWERAAQEYLSLPFDEASMPQRIEAFVRSITDRDAGAGLRLLVGQVWGDDVDQHWIALTRRWTRAPGEEPSLRQRIVIFAAQGLWMNDLSGEVQQTQGQRDDVVAWLLDTLRALDGGRA